MRGEVVPVGHGEAIMRRLGVALTMVLVLPCPSVALASDHGAKVESVMEVSTDRHAYVDGSEHARFRLRGQCIRPRPWLVVRRDRCGDKRGTIGTVRLARLGFDVAHTVDAGERTVPVVQVASRVDQVQISTIVVALHRGGDLRVRLDAAGSHGVPASVVHDTAQPSPSSRGRAYVEWLVPDARAGQYKFTVGVRFDQPQPVTDSYVPAVTTELSSTGRRHLDAYDGPVVGRRGPQRATLTMRAHSAPAFGAPDVRASPWFIHSDGVTGLGVQRLSMHAKGAYHTPTSGPKRIDSSIKRPHGPTSWLQTTSWVDTDKVAGDLPFSTTHLLTSLRTSNVVETAPRPAAQPTAGWIYDGDSIDLTFVAAGASARADEDRLPASNTGELVAGRPSQAVREWATFIAGTVPAGEGNSLHSTSPGTPKPRGHMTTVFSIPVTASRGDIDNRASDASVFGQPVEVRAPAGHQLTRVTHSFVAPGQAQPDYLDVADRGELGLDLDKVTLTPMVGPGGYWLDARDRNDWKGYFLVVLDSVPATDSITRTYGEVTMSAPPGTYAEARTITRLFGRAPRPR